MLGTLTTLVSFAFVLGVLVFVHELGHFLAAKRVGIKVLKFQLGFNPTILSFRRGDTEYGIGALPLGGYVKMAGDNPDETRLNAPDEFLSKSKWERFQVLIMGPVMNLGLAVILLAAVFYQGAPRLAFEDQPVIIGAVERDSAAVTAGIRPGDQIVAVSGTAVGSWEHFYNVVLSRRGEELDLEFLRNGERTRTKLTPRPPETSSPLEIGELGVLPNTHPHIASIVPGEAAERAGLKTGDVVVAVNGEPITFQTHLKKAISTRPEQTITIEVLRSGSPMTITATPARRGNEGLLGITMADDVISIKPGVIGALVMSTEKNIEISGMIFQTVWGLLTLQTSPKQLMGPVAIAQLSGESAQQGWIPLLLLMAQISLNLGLLNLLPIPVLDGGHIFIMSLEGLARRDFSIPMKEKMLFGGFVVLMLLMVTVIYNDLTRISWIEGLMPWR